MNDFLDEYLPDEIHAFPFISTPRTSTTIVTVSSGAEQRNGNWIDPLRRFTAPEVVRSWDIIEDLKDHWLCVSGPLLSFPLRDPMDFASTRLLRPNLVPTISDTDQVIGIGNGTTVDFQLSKTYTRGAVSYVRNITLPIVSSVVIAVNAVPMSSDWIVDRETGIVTFSSPPANNAIITAGYLFDNQVRFENDDSFDLILKSFQLGGAADLTFLQVRPC